MRGDLVIAAVPSGTEEVVIIAGNIHEFYDRVNQVRIGGFPLRIPAGDCVLAKDCYDAYAAPIVAKNKSDAEDATKQPPQ